MGKKASPRAESDTVPAFSPAALFRASCLGSKVVGPEWHFRLKYCIFNHLRAADFHLCIVGYRTASAAVSLPLPGPTAAPDSPPRAPSPSPAHRPQRALTLTLAALPCPPLLTPPRPRATRLAFASADASA